MTSDRSYKRAVSKDIAIEEIKNNSGEQFDPEIVEIFCRIKTKSKYISCSTKKE